MFIHYRTQGIILRKVDRGEYDQLFTVYTKEFGKIDVLGKGIRKISSKLRSGMEIFYLAEIEFIQGKTYKTLTDAILIDKFKNLRKSLPKLNVAHKVSGLLDNLIYSQEQEEKIWDLLLQALENLNSAAFKTKNLRLVYYYFFWNLILELGYSPELYGCAICRKNLEPKKIYFSQKEGGLICQDCFLKTKSGKDINPEIVKILRIILEKSWPTASRIKIEKEHLKPLNIIYKDYLSFILERDNVI
ncbi:MAG: DNA repair protein RecO [Patescibacteria group bacterium]|nr:DNA repair protein RecO [Patescibacteria group bacterium]